MFSILLLSMAGTADAGIHNNNNDDDEALDCHYINGKLVCNEPVQNPQGGLGDTLVEIRTSDAEEQSDHPWLIFASFDGIDDWYAFTMLKDSAVEATYGPAVEGVPDIAEVLEKDVNGDGEDDLLIEADGGEFRVWYGPFNELRQYDDHDDTY